MGYAEEARKVLDLEKAVLMRAARVADDDGAQGLYGALFARAKAAPKKKAKKAPTTGEPKTEPK